MTNVIGSALAREATVLYMHAGPDRRRVDEGVLDDDRRDLPGLWLGRQRGAITAEDVKKRIHDLVEIPRLVDARRPDRDDRP